MLWTVPPPPPCPLGSRLVPHIPPSENGIHARAPADLYLLLGELLECRYTPVVHGWNFNFFSTQNFSVRLLLDILNRSGVKTSFSLIIISTIVYSTYVHILLVINNLTRARTHCTAERVRLIFFLYNIGRYRSYTSVGSPHLVSGKYRYH